MIIFHKMKFFIQFNISMLFVFLHWSILHASPEEHHHIPSINLTVNNGGPVATATNLNALTQKQVQEFLQDMNLKVTQDVNHSINWPSLPSLSLPDSQPIKNFFSSPYDSIRSHPYLCILATLMASYAWINYQIRKTKILLQEHDAWCNWKSMVPLAHLQLTNGQDLLTQLKIDLYKKYALITSHASTCDYTSMFISDIKNELALLNNYIYWYELTSTIKCCRLFCFGYDLAAIQEKKTRLLFILDFFMAWFSKNHENIAYSH